MFKYNKAVAALITTALTYFVAKYKLALSDQVVELLVMGLTSVVVYLVPNLADPPAPTKPDEIAKKDEPEKKDEDQTPAVKFANPGSRGLAYLRASTVGLALVAFPVAALPLEGCKNPADARSAENAILSTEQMLCVTAGLAADVFPPGTTEEDVASKFVGACEIAPTLTRDVFAIVQKFGAKKKAILRMKAARPDAGAVEVIEAAKDGGA